MLTRLILLAQDPQEFEEFQDLEPGSAAGGIVLLIVGLAVTVVMIVALWKVFTKAGQPGWASIIPLYNAYILFRIVGRPGWWLILLFIPFVNFIISIIVAIDLAQSFGKSGGFAVGLIILPFIFYPVLAFGDAQYRGPVRSQGHP